jgi:chaperonin GroES
LKVIRTGPGAHEEGDKFKPVGLKEGDKVIYFKYAGDKMMDPAGDEYVILHENDILGRI